MTVMLPVHTLPPPRPLRTDPLTALLEALQHLAALDGSAVVLYTSKAELRLTAYYDALCSLANTDKGPWVYIQWRGAHPESADPQLMPLELLAALMRERQVTQGQLAREIGTSRNTVSRVLRGEREISRDLAVKLATYFNRPRSDFL